MLKRAIYLIPLLAGLLVIAVVSSVYLGDEENHAHKSQAKTMHALSMARGGLNNEVNETKLLAKAFLAIVGAGHNLTRYEFSTFAKGLLAQSGFIRSVLVLKGAEVSYVFPDTNGDAILGKTLEYFKPATVQTYLERARQSHGMLMTGRDEAFQNGVITLFAPTPSRSSADDDWTVVLLIDAERMFENAGLNDPFGDVELALSSSISQSDERQIMAGDDVIFDMNPVVGALAVPSGVWQLAAVPSGGWAPSPYRKVILLFGTLAVFLVPASLWAVLSMLMGRIEDRDKYQHLVQNAKSIILRIDMGGVITFCNEYAEEFFGYGPGELIGQPLIGSIIPQRDFAGQSMKRYLNRLLKNPSAHPFNETMNVRKNGEIVWVAWANDAERTRDGVTEGLLCVGTDITDRKLMEEALRQREKQYRLLAENVTDIIMGLDADLRLTYISPSDEVVRGFKRYDVLGREIEDFLTPKSRERLVRVMSLLDSQKGSGEASPSLTFDMEFLCADGGTVWLETQFGMLFNDEGERVGIQAVGRNITDRKLADALREDVERMARHDLKTPLGAVIGLPEEIRRQGALNPTQEDMLNIIESAGNAMLQLINRSLDLYKMECGTYVLDRCMVDVVSVLERIKAEAKPLIMDKGISVGIEVLGDDASCFRANVEEELFRSMLSNLILNGLQASPESGTLSVVLEKRDGIVIHIRNQGEVPASVRDTFFEKYSTSNTSRGSGLGTYSARLIARTHGGDIVVNTGTPGETSVIVTLPDEPC